MKIGRMRFAYLSTKATNTLSEYVICIYCFFYDKNGSANAPQCYVILTLTDLC